MDWDQGFSTNSPEYRLLEVDMEEFRSEKTVKTGKSLEEIEKLMVDENLSEIERACLLISTGQDVQKMCVIDQLPTLLQTRQTDTLCKVLPKLCAILPPASLPVQEAASKAFTKVAERQLVPVHIFTQSFLPTVLGQLESKDPSISAVWLAAVLAAVPYLPKDVIKREVLNVAVAKGQLSQTVASRQASCQIIGKIATKFEPFWLKRELLPLATSLCQDVDRDVRSCMCQQLNRLARALSLEIARSSLLPELIELTNDEECNVRIAAIETLAEMVSFLDDNTLKSSIIPLVQRFCDQALSAGDSSLPVVARLLGRLCHELKDLMSPEQRTRFLDLFRKLSQYSGPQQQQARTPSSVSLMPNLTGETVEVECRRLCAYNFPAMLLFMGSSGFSSELSSTFKRLVEDESPRVRRTVACGFHEVAKLLAGKSTSILSHYQTLLRDTSPEVLLGLVGHLPDVMELFAEASNLSSDTRQPGLLELIPPLLACEQKASNCRQWRLHEELLSSFSCLVHCMTSEQLFGKFCPVLFRCITNNYVLPVKLAASRTLCLLIRNIRRAEQRHELCAKIVGECAHAPGCRLRLLFMDLCQCFLDTFSRAFFKENFYEALLALAVDPVVNVRLRLCRVLPQLKAILKLPGDRVLLQQLETTVRRLIAQERDPDASQAVREAVMELDRIEVAMESLSRRTFLEADLTDQRREEEERLLVLAEEREKEGGGEKRQASGTKCSPAPARTQLGKKGKSAKSPVVGRKGSGVTISLPGTPGPSSPALIHKGIGNSKVRGYGSTPTAIHKSLSSPSSTGTTNHIDDRLGGGGREVSGRRTSGGTSAGNLGSPAHSPGPAKHSIALSRPKNVDKKTPSSSSPPSTHTAKPSSARTSPSTTSKLAVSKSKDQVTQSSKTSSNPAGNIKKKAHQQYGSTYKTKGT